MAITYPRELPSYRLVTATFTLMDAVTSFGSAKGGVINRVQTAIPFWSFEAETVPMWPREKGVWTAWKASLQGGLKTFVAYDPTRSPPLAYPDVTAPTQIKSGWNGTATVTNIGTGGAVSLSGLPASYKVSVGDRISLEQGGLIGYFEVLENATATSGGVVTLTVAPFLQLMGFSTAAVARLWQPKAKFIIDWESWSNPVPVGLSSISFKAVQAVAG